jgi:anti-sigma-K factor RskA
VVLLNPRYRPRSIETSVRYRARPTKGRLLVTLQQGRRRQEVRIRMTWKPNSTWRTMLYSVAALAMLALAAGARYKPH